MTIESARPTKTWLRRFALLSGVLALVAAGACRSEDDCVEVYDDTAVTSTVYTGADGVDLEVDGDFMLEDDGDHFAVVPLWIYDREQPGVELFDATIKFNRPASFGRFDLSDLDAERCECVPDPYYLCEEQVCSPVEGTLTVMAVDSEGLDATLEVEGEAGVATFAFERSATEVCGDDSGGSSSGGCGMSWMNGFAG
ncbi:MAG: hypothetical protein U0271_26050 [Polyangiaceae bacterium]